MDFPSGLALPHPLSKITPFSGCALGGAGSLGTIGSGTYPAANRANFYPFRLAEPFLVKVLFCVNGVAVSGNIDIGLFDEVFTRLVSSGSTAQAGVSTIQTFDVADTLLGPGIFYLAVAMDNTTGALNRVAPGAAVARALGLGLQATAFPLPATAAPSSGAVTYIPVIGAGRYAVV